MDHLQYSHTVGVQFTYCDMTETRQKYTDDSLDLSIKFWNAQCSQHWVICTIKVECTSSVTHSVPNDNQLDAGNLHNSCTSGVDLYKDTRYRYNAKYTCTEHTTTINITQPTFSLNHIWHRHWSSTIVQKLKELSYDFNLLLLNQYHPHSTSNPSPIYIFHISCILLS